MGGRGWVYVNPCFALFGTEVAAAAAPTPECTSHPPRPVTASSYTMAHSLLPNDLHNTAVCMCASINPGRTLRDSS
ncbi:hypothetical protein DMENIID0001_120130 [Sergentomyia squamirostris]